MRWGGKEESGVLDAAGVRGGRKDPALFAAISERAVLFQLPRGDVGAEAWLLRAPRG